MGFLVPCPICGSRDVYEFKFGLEVKTPPREGAGLDEWREYLYFHRNAMGVQEEWWYHAFGCQTWFKLRRDTNQNLIVEG